MIFFMFFFFLSHNQGHLSATDLYLWQKFGLSQLKYELCLGVLLFGDCMCVAPSWFLWFVFLPSGLVSSHSPKMLDKWWFKMVIWVSVGTNKCSSVSLCLPCNRWATFPVLHLSPNIGYDMLHPVQEYQTRGADNPMYSTGWLGNNWRMA